VAGDAVLTMTDAQRHTNSTISILAWLEDTLREERQVVGLALARQHVALMKQLAPQLEGVHWKGDPPVRKEPFDFAVLSNGQVSRRSDFSYTSKPGPGEQWKELGIRVEQGTWNEEGVKQADNQEPPSSVSKVVSSHWAIGSEDNESGPQRLPKEDGMLVMNAVAADPAMEVPEVEMEQRSFCWMYRKLQDIVSGPYFEGTFAMLILINILIMAIESQYIGIESGYEVGYPGSKNQATETWPGADTAFEIVEWIFGVLFTLELIVKFSCIGCHFFKEVWNTVDLIIVLSWLATAIGDMNLPLDPMLLRLARLARLLRVLRLVRTVRAFDSLYLMTTSMTGSFSVLVWSVVILFLVLMMLAFLLQQLTMKYVRDDSAPNEGRKEVFKYYGSFARCMLSMFEITLGNWIVPCRALVENVSEWYMLFFLAHKLVIGFSVVSVITAVFIQETFKVATTDDRIMIMNKERGRKTNAAKIGALFEHEGAGDYIDFEQIKNVLANPEKRIRLAAMELDVRDPRTFFSLLDKDGDGQISFDELLDGVARLKGQARSYDVLSLQSSTVELKELVQELRQRFV